MTRIIGDIHGDLVSYKHIIAGCDRSIQVGDFGIGFRGEYWHKKVNEIHSDKNHRFIRGNHDNPTMCKNMMDGYIPDGTVENNAMFIGGAWSIDYAHRTENLDWWRDEECTYSELNMFINIYEQVKPDIMITHDCPTIAAKKMFIEQGKSITNGKQFYTRTADALQTMFETHKPKYHFFGHWHHTLEMDIEGTHFHCLGENDYVDFDFVNMRYV